MSMDATRNFVNGCEFLKGHIFRRWFMTELNQNGVAIPNIKTPRYYCNEHRFLGAQSDSQKKPKHLFWQ